METKLEQDVTERQNIAGSLEKVDWYLQVIKSNQMKNENVNFDIKIVLWNPVTILSN